jgi:hypothetical protein
MKNTLQTVLTISNTDIVTMLVVKQKEELILKFRQQKIDLLSKYVAILETNTKDGMKIIQRCNTKRCKNSCFSL